MAITGGSDFGWLDVELNTSDLDRLELSVLSPAAIKRIQSRAINETTAWIKSRLLRELPSATGLPRKNLLGRVRQGMASANLNAIITGKVWLGIKPIDAMALKDEGAIDSGYMAGGFYFKGGFKAVTKSGHTGIFARKSKARLPIRRQNVRIDSFANEVVRRLIPQAEQQLSSRTQRLIGFELERATR
ncbi:hypothetical protein B0F88_103108 [Methylobacter tundripaludum]|uniref:Minor tail protein Z (GPZ) n=1 Tax=Methylobacter tundripaludum TaxID=173365 RepID=A0A2S6H5A9_9GAMM|nr:hypothetical protein [Methylobacter tundripaludum]PPK72675.1 hypothetical protein B0F88_103108 [Methylobacter tundripaludum]